MKATEKIIPSLTSTPGSKKEVELKIKVTEEVFTALKTILHHVASFKEEISQRDQYLDHPDHSFYAEDSKCKDISLRVRESSSESSITVKLPKKGEEVNDFFRYEYEVEIKDPKTTLEIFHLLGYKDVKLLSKIRTIFTYQYYEIVLDKISGIGCFVEIEMKKKVDDHKKCINEMEMFLRDVLGITEYEKQMTGIETYMKK